MTKIKLKIKNSGFVILFAVTLSAILLAIALGVANIALKEVKFGTSAIDTNDAFFAADTGVEKVLFEDKDPAVYPAVEGGIATFDPIIISELGGSSESCAVVTITKDNVTDPSITTTTIVSKGYNSGGETFGSCNPPANSTERELKVTY